MQKLPFFMLMNSPFNNFSQNGLDFDFITNILSFMKQITCTYMYLVQRLLNKRALASDLLYTYFISIYVWCDNNLPKNKPSYQKNPKTHLKWATYNKAKMNWELMCIGKTCISYFYVKPFFTSAQGLTVKQRILKFISYS